MGSPIWLRTCLTKMAVNSVFAPMQVCVGCGKSPSGADFSVGRRHVLRWERFMSAVSKSRALPGQSTALVSQVYSRALLKNQKRNRASEANRGVLAEDETDSNDDKVQCTNGFEENEIADDEMAQALAAMTGTISLTSEVPVASTSLCVGIDPDLSGAISVLKTRNNCTVAEVIDVPCVTVTVNKRKRRRHDYNSIAILVGHLQAPEGSIAYVEQAMPFPKDGKQGWYITGYGYGVWLGILATAGFTVIPVQARIWKSAMGLYGKEFTKDDSRALASSMFPELSSLLQRKKDHGRAEALLIGAFGKGMSLTSISSLVERTSLNSIVPPDEPHPVDSISSSCEPPF